MSTKKVIQKINAQGMEISVIPNNNRSDDYISLTDIARYKSDNPTAVIQNWMRDRETLEFLGLWEKLNNPDFKPLEFEGFKMESGRNAFALSPQKWITATGAKGIRSKSGRYGGTFAHVDIAMEFASWISPEFKLYVIKDYQRLKNEEVEKLSPEWTVTRILSKINYRIHTDAIKMHLLSNRLTSAQISITYASEADVLNMALFGTTARDWRQEHTDRAKNENIRDMASIEELIVLSNLESINAELIKNGMEQKARLIELNRIAREQLESLLAMDHAKQLKELDKTDKGSSTIKGVLS